ncbi:MAG: 3-methyl-2-oxobutanoate hydroxymethyltransferase [Burkholderiales bacterium]
MRLTLKDLGKKYAAGQKITMVTVYDASFAAVAEQAGIDILFIGDSLGMTVQGHDSPLPVTLEDMVYHTRAVVRGSKQGFVIGDLPFGTYHESPAQAFRNAAQLMRAGANMVKLEGGAVMAPTVEFLTQRGIPVCGHLGLTPQSFNTLGGFRVQGKTEDAAQRLINDAKALQSAGMTMLVLEAIPATLGKDVTANLTVPTIGIGAGPHCAGQVLLAYDLLDIFPGTKAKFVKNFMATSGSVSAAFANFVREVKDGTFPGPEHCY